MKKNTSPFVIGAGAVAVLSLTGATFTQLHVGRAK